MTTVLRPFAAPVSPGPAADRTGAVSGAAFEKFAAPAAVRSADASAWRGLFPAHYADPHTREFPVHTPESAAASAAVYHHLGGPADHPVAARLKAACDRQGLVGLWEKLAAEAAPPPPAAPTRFCLPAEGRYPCDTADRVKEAADYLTRFGRWMEPDDRREYARNLLAAGEDLGGLPADVVPFEHAAGYGRPADLDGVFVPRLKAASRFGKADLVAILERVRDSVRDGGDPYRAAEAVKAADAACGWGFGDPTEQLTGLTPSRAKAAAASVVVAPSGRVYRTEDLHVVTPEVAASWGPSAAFRAKQAELLRTDPAFEAAAGACGLVPVAVPAEGVIDWDALAG